MTVNKDFQELLTSEDVKRKIEDNIFDDCIALNFVTPVYRKTFKENSRMFNAYLPLASSELLPEQMNDIIKAHRHMWCSKFNRLVIDRIERCGVRNAQTLNYEETEVDLSNVPEDKWKKEIDKAIHCLRSRLGENKKQQPGARVSIITNWRLATLIPTESKVDFEKKNGELYKTGVIDGASVYYTEKY